MSWKTAGVLPDMHIPYHDTPSLDLVELILKDLGKLSEIIQVGDFVDAYPISKYAKNPAKASGFDLQHEIDEAHKVIRRLTNIAPLTILEGNHEVRLEKYLKEKAPGLYGLKTLKIKKLLTDITEVKRGKEVQVQLKNPVSYQISKYLGKLFVFHGDLWTKSGSRHAGQTAMQNVDRSGLNVMHGHIHRIGTYNVTKKGYELKGYEIGCLCEMDVEYCHSPNWQWGFSVVTYRDNGDKAFFAEIVEIEKTATGRRAFFRGKLYEVKEKKYE